MKTETENLDLRKEIDKATSGLANLNGAGDPEALIEALEKDILKGRLEHVVRREVSASERPNFLPHIADGNQLAKMARTRQDRYLIDRLTDWDSTSLVVAPSNVGGSTFMLHLARCLLTGLPVLGQYSVSAEDRYAVLWINPEEQADTPGERLTRMGMQPDDLANFHQIHTRDERLYFNQPGHVEALLEAIDAMRIDPALHLVIYVDGFQGTLSGDLWGQDLEDWKNGIGTMREAAKPVALTVRAQTTTAGQRKSKSSSKLVTAEDAAGGQIMHWPDNRLVLNRRDNDERLLTVRGRLQDSEWSIAYEWNPETYELVATDGVRSTMAALAIGKLLNGDEWRGLGLTSKHKIADHLVSQHPDGPSKRTYQRALEAWEYDPEAEAWEAQK